MSITIKDKTPSLTLGAGRGLFIINASVLHKNAFSGIRYQVHMVSFMYYYISDKHNEGFLSTTLIWIKPKQPILLTCKVED